MSMIQPESYTEVEGGDWIKWPLSTGFEEVWLDGYERADQITLHGLRIHAMRFAGGREWDSINHWREKPKLTATELQVGKRTTNLDDPILPGNISLTPEYLIVYTGKTWHRFTVTKDQKLWLLHDLAKDLIQDAPSRSREGL